MNIRNCLKNGSMKKGARHGIGLRLNTPRSVLFRTSSSLAYPPSDTGCPALCACFRHQNHHDGADSAPFRISKKKNHNRYTQNQMIAVVVPRARIFLCVTCGACLPHLRLKHVLLPTSAPRHQQTPHSASYRRHCCRLVVLPILEEKATETITNQIVARQNIGGR
jgi:hypothetical protein